jgi:hypothetical protein
MEPTFCRETQDGEPALMKRGRGGLAFMVKEYATPHLAKMSHEWE